ncbi:O-antigen ligase family protein [Luteimonas sp. MC1828]|uniref:O-antigen ligase family protein n=1 Tax=Luteimonas sp. MC1828 TaxID=2799787 RepID=UPI0018F2783D|nr:O-antigen ligase family protein [Luteimonas sp. MC1828]MBJ7574515.1 O-antigen ligase family protein [Luteimonas sp. MC1828]
MPAFVFIVAYLILVLIRPQEYPRWADSGVPFLPVALILAVLAWLASRNKRFDEPQYPLLVLFTVATGISVAVNGWLGGAVEQYKQFMPTLVAFVLLANAITTRRRTEQVMVVFILCALLLAWHGVEQSALGVGWTGMPLVEDGRIQYVGIFSDPNDLGLLFVICLPMTVYMGSRGGMMGMRRLLWVAVGAFLLYGVYLTNSRGAMLAVVVMAGAHVWLRRGPMLAALIAAGCLTTMRLMPSRLTDLDVQEGSATGRVEAWYEGFRMFVENPLFGVGTGSFEEYHTLTAHNSLILVLAENGLVGFIPWLAFVGYCFWMMLRVVRHSPELADGDSDSDGDDADDVANEIVAAESWATDRAIAWTLLVSLAGFATCAFFLSRSYLILFYLLAAVVVAHFTDVRQRWPDVVPFRLRQDLVRWVLYSGVAVVVFYLILKVLLARL